jgi:putative glutamine amidotransferase
MKTIGITPRFIAGDQISAGSSAVDRMAVVDANNQLVTRFGALPLTLPMLRELDGASRAEALGTIVRTLDGLLLQGGTDVEPHRYGEAPLRPEWAGDAIRDRLEFDLVEAFLKADKPILGVCRGFQVLNVAFGGTLYQDIPTQHALDAGCACVSHDSNASYCGATHEITLTPGGELARLYGCTQGLVNSAHHQGVKALGAGLRLAASAPDGVCEGLHAPSYRFVLAVQWHPEFHHLDAKLLPPAPLMHAFLAAMAHV